MGRVEENFNREIVRELAGSVWMKTIYPTSKSQWQPNINPRDLDSGLKRHCTNLMPNACDIFIS